MNVHIYTDIDTLFGRACRIWMDVLLSAGHEVEYVDLGTSTSVPLPNLDHSDINLLICGICAFERFGQHGLPKGGKNILWMLDPLTSDSAASVHNYKATLFDVFANQLDAVIAMDAPIENYLHQHYPELPTFRIPYMVAEKHIRSPVPELDKALRAIFMGGTSPNRARAEQLFNAARVPVDFVSAGLWGVERDERLRQAAVVLSIHADSAHTYFDQFRTLDAWAAGTVLLLETTDGLDVHGIEPGVHLMMADLAEMPQACAALLKDAGTRQAMVTHAQALLQERFLPQHWSRKMLEALDMVQDIH